MNRRERIRAIKDDFGPPSPVRKGDEELTAVVCPQCDVGVMEAEYVKEGTEYTFYCPNRKCQGSYILQCETSLGDLDDPTLLGLLRDACDRIRKQMDAMI